MVKFYKTLPCRWKRH